MKISAFCRGLLIGAAVGIAIDMMGCATQTRRKTTVGKAMQRMGNAMDSALDDISDRLH